MALPEDPQQNIIYLIATALAGAVIGLWEIIRRIVRKEGHPEIEGFREQICRDMSRIEKKIDKVVSHAETADERIGRLEVRVAVVETKVKGK